MSGIAYDNSGKVYSDLYRIRLEECRGEVMPRVDRLPERPHAFDQVLYEEPAGERVRVGWSSGRRPELLPFVMRSSHSPN